MEKVITEQKVIEDKYHMFYCDSCGVLVGMSEECDDGYYPKYGEYEQKIYLNGYGWMSYKRCLCETCANKKTENIKTILSNIGFEKENLR